MLSPALIVSHSSVRTVRTQLGSSGRPQGGRILQDEKHRLA